MLTRLPRAAALVIVAALTTFVASAYADGVEDLVAPEGFIVDILVDDVKNARQMALTDGGTLIIGTRRSGRVYAVPNALTAPDPEVITLLKGLKMPSGVAVRDGDLYIAATSEVLKVEDIDEHLAPKPPTVTITDDLPDKRHHGWKYIKFGPDQQLYVPVGAPCNICLSDDERFASLLRMDPSSGATELWAAGIRNTVGFAWHPEIGDLWFSDNGRDMLGDDVPPEEINRIGGPGQHFGYPFVHARGIVDPEFGDHAAANDLETIPPTLEIQAHSAALGMDFYTGDAFPAAYRHALFIAEHGSWNRSSKVGYRVSVVLERGDELVYRPFIEGWLQGEKAWGRPNDVLVTPGGDLLISDDAEGVVYRVRYAPRALADSP